MGFRLVQRVAAAEEADMCRDGAILAFRTPKLLLNALHRGYVSQASIRTPPAA